MYTQEKQCPIERNNNIYKMFKHWSNIIEGTKLVRTDSTTLRFIPKNKNNSQITPIFTGKMGQEDMLEMF